MSENAITPHKYSVNMDDFIRFLEEKTEGSKCPACWSDTWVLIGSADNEMAFRHVTPLRDGPRTSTTFSEFGIYCDNCGFVRQHLARFVKQWVDNNPVQEQMELDEIDQNDGE